MTVNRSSDIGRRSLGRYLLGVAATTMSHAAPAAPLPAPAEVPILSITGKIRFRNIGKSASFDRPMLEAVGVTTLTTSTVWHRQPQRFEGVLVSQLLRQVGAFGTSALASALDEYVADIRVAELAKYGAIIALKRDGEYIAVSAGGPLLIMYPFDIYPTLNSAEYYRHCVWHLAELEIQ